MLLSMVFACTIGIGLYGLIDHKMHSEPWRMLVIALIAIVLGTGMVMSFEALSSVAHELESMRSASALFNAVASSLGGALIGAAVSNKASILHRREVGRLEEEIVHLRSILAEVEKAAAEGAESVREDQVGSAFRMAELRKMLNKIERDRHKLG